MTSIEYGGTLEHIKDFLGKYTLEDFSGIVLHPTWRSKESTEKFKGCSTISGNFIEWSNAFYIITDDENLISELKPYFTNKVFSHYDYKNKIFVKA